MRLLLDQGLPPGAVPLLQSIGWDAVHVRDIGMRAANDVDILERAAVENRVCATLDRDFPEILARTHGRKPTVTLFRMNGLKAARLVAILMKLEDQFADALQRGAVLSVREHAVRVRMLPIGLLDEKD